MLVALPYPATWLRQIRPDQAGGVRAGVHGDAASAALRPYPSLRLTGRPAPRRIQERHASRRPRFELGAEIGLPSGLGHPMQASQHAGAEIHAMHVRHMAGQFQSDRPGPAAYVQNRLAVGPSCESTPVRNTPTASPPPSFAARAFHISGVLGRPTATMCCRLQFGKSQCRSCTWTRS